MSIISLRNRVTDLHGADSLSTLIERRLAPFHFGTAPLRPACSLRSDLFDSCLLERNSLYDIVETLFPFSRRSIDRSILSYLAVRCHNDGIRTMVFVGMEDARTVTRAMINEARDSLLSALDIAPSHGRCRSPTALASGEEDDIGDRLPRTPNKRRVTLPFLEGRAPRLENYVRSSMKKKKKRWISTPFISLPRIFVKYTRFAPSLERPRATTSVVSSSIKSRRQPSNSIRSK